MTESDNELPDNVQLQQPPQLTAIELRVLGVLMEKQLTTPDQYPLTVNSIVSGCNQKSSRDPVTHYDQGDVVRTLRALEDRHFIRKEYSSRADKYTQQFMQHLQLSKKHQAVLCLMMLRGPQTLSELSTRTQRMELFIDKEDLMHCIDRLCERALPYAIRLGTQPGQRGERFGHLFSGIPEVSHSPPGIANTPPSLTTNDNETLSQLESQINGLNNTVQQLKHENEVLRHQLESLYALTGHPLTP